MTMPFRDAYTDKPTTWRGELEERIREFKCTRWVDRGDDGLRELLAEAEAAQRAFDRAGKGSAP